MFLRGKKGKLSLNYSCCPFLSRFIFWTNRMNQVCYEMTLYKKFSKNVQHSSLTEGLNKFFSHPESANNFIGLKYLKVLKQIRILL